MVTNADKALSVTDGPFIESTAVTEEISKEINPSWAPVPPPCDQHLKLNHHEIALSPEPQPETDLNKKKV